MDGFTPEEHARALLLVHRRMLEAIWVHLLVKYRESDAEAEAAEESLLRALAAELAPVGGRDVLVADLARSEMEAMWSVIRDSLASLARPIDVAALGLEAPKTPPRPGDTDATDQ